MTVLEGFKQQSPNTLLSDTTGFKPKNKFSPREDGKWETSPITQTFFNEFGQALSSQLHFKTSILLGKKERKKV